MVSRWRTHPGNSTILPPLSHGIRAAADETNTLTRLSAEIYDGSQDESAAIGRSGFWYPSRMPWDGELRDDQVMAR